MNLNYTKQLLKEKLNNNDFDSYAIKVFINGRKEVMTSENVNMDTYFDVASMGKVLVTSTLILKAIGEKKLNLTDTLDSFFETVPEDKKDITLHQLLTHTSGIVRIPIPNRVADCGKDKIAELILDTPLAFKPGSDYVYSCNGYILLGFILEKLYGMPLDVIYRETTVKTLDLTRSRFKIALDEKNAAICYRCKDVGKIPCDDENVYTMGGVAGSGGSFSSLNDIDKFIKAILEKDNRLYKEELFDLAERDYTPEFAEGRGLGYLIVNEKYHQTGELFPTGSFGHCGHCGQSFFINRDMNMYVIILTNATRFASMKNDFKWYDYGVIMKMREELHNEIYKDLKSENLL